MKNVALRCGTEMDLCVKMEALREEVVGKTGFSF